MNPRPSHKCQNSQSVRIRRQNLTQNRIRNRRQTLTQNRIPNRRQTLTQNQIRWNRRQTLTQNQIQWNRRQTLTQNRIRTNRRQTLTQNRIPILIPNPIRIHFQGNRRMALCSPDRTLKFRPSGNAECCFRDDQFAIDAFHVRDYFDGQGSSRASTG